MPSISIPIIPPNPAYEQIEILKKIEAHLSDISEQLSELVGTSAEIEEDTGALLSIANGIQLTIEDLRKST